MKHPSCRGLYAYWIERRGERPLPERSDIKPGAIRDLLGDSFVLSGILNGCRFRVAGSRICGLFGRELRGELFGSIWDADGGAVMRDALAAVAEEEIGFVAGVEARYGDSVATTFELLVLPLSYRGTVGARLLGILAAFGPPSWVGIRPAEPLRLGALRYLTGAAPSNLSETATSDPVDLRRNFTVIEGGLI
jgi:hypothetical protein